jgi:hypothetical protein
MASKQRFVLRTSMSGLCNAQLGEDEGGDGDEDGFAFIDMEEELVEDEH